MTSRREFNPEKPQGTKLDFVVTHDGTQPPVSERKRELIADQFSSLVTDILLNFADQVEHYNHSQEDSLLLIKQDDNDPTNVEWTLAVRKKTDDYDETRGIYADTMFEPADHTRQEISLQRIVNGYGRDMYGYRLGADGVVRRWTNMDVKASIDRSKALSRPLGGNALQQTASLREEIVAEIPNDRLEREMGLNKAPISMNELAGLNEFITKPGFEVPAMFKRRPQTSS